MSYKNSMILIYKEIKSIIFGGRESENNQKLLDIYYSVYREVVWASFLYPCFMKSVMMEITSVFHFHLSCFVFHSLENIQPFKLYFAGLFSYKLIFTKNIMRRQNKMFFLLVAKL